MQTRTCATCACYAKSICRRYPQPVQKEPEDWCFEHRWVLPSEEILGTDIELLPVCYATTRRLCKACGLKTVRDILAVGRSGILNNKGLPDPKAIQDLTTVFETLEVHW